MVLLRTTVQLTVYISDSIAYYTGLCQPISPAYLDQIIGFRVWEHTSLFLASLTLLSYFLVLFSFIFVFLLTIYSFFKIRLKYHHLTEVFPKTVFSPPTTHTHIHIHSTYTHHTYTVVEIVTPFPSLDLI